jgi:hypothetical protein
VTPLVPKPLTSGAKADGRFGKQDFIYDPQEDAYLSNGAQTDPRIGAQKGPLFGDKCRRQRSPRRSWSGLRSRGERGLASSRLLEGQARFLKRQLSLPVSTMSQ